MLQLSVPYAHSLANATTMRAVIAVVVDDGVELALVHSPFYETLHAIYPKATMQLAATTNMCSTLNTIQSNEPSLHMKHAGRHMNLLVTTK